MATLSELFVVLGLKKDGLDKGLNETGKSFQATGDKLKGIGTKMTLGVTAPILAVGAGLLKVGADADEATDIIATKTGAVGDELDALAQSALNVFTQIPTDMNIAAEALGTLAAKTDQTGKGLEDLTATTIRLGEVTGEDLGTLINSTTDVFKNWNVAAEDQVGTLDKLLIASQKTGVPVAALSDSLTKYGPILRGMGLSLDESIALLGTFEEAGLDLNSTTKGLQTAFKEFAEAGVDPKQALIGIFDQIKNAPDDVTAAQLAIDTFGQKAGPGLAEAIRLGKLGYEDLLATIETSDQTVLSMAESTDDAAQKFKVLKNQAIAAAIPLGTALFGAINDLMPLLTDLIGYLVSAITFFTNLPGPVQKIIVILVALLAAAGPVIGVIGTIITIVGALSAALPVLGVALGIILSPIGLIVLAVAALYLAWKTNFFGFRDITQDVIGAVLGFFSGLVDWFTGGGLSGIVDAIWGVAQSLIDAGVSFLIWYYTLPIEIAKIFVDLVEMAVGFAEDFIGSFTELPGKIAEPFLGLFNTFFNIGYSIIQGLVAGIQAIWNTLVGWVNSILDQFNRIPDFLKPGSPSKTATYWAESVMSAFTTTFGQKMPELRASVEDVNATLSGVAPSIGGVDSPSGASPSGMMSGVTVIIGERAIVIEGVTDPQEVADAVMERLETGIGRVIAGEGFA